MKNNNPQIKPGFPFRIEVPRFVGDILSMLRKNGFRAFIVGGAIRDALLERKAFDWDITTDAEVHEVQAVFKGIRQFSLKHKTVTLVHSGIPFEVTTMKGPDGEVDIYTDLSHRDFTLNAMAYDDKRSIVLDPHDGATDIK
ncbi:MAG: polynucleotide adenylyltransferase, partial [Deltaproteobacteria bacterium]|nr:polynucleotide adenylyltransferase [Deltaproteobacteria bacterium]